MLTLLPRILAILYIAFISMFALDVFGGGYGLWGTIQVDVTLRPVGFQPCSLASRIRAEASAFFLLVELPTTLPVLIAMIFQGFLPLRLIIL